MIIYKNIMQDNSQIFNTIDEMVLYLKYLFVTVFSPSTWKTLGAFGYVVFSFFFDVNQTNALFALFILIIIDFITGITAAKIAGDRIRSSKVRHSAIKVCAYFAVIAGAHLAEAGLYTHISFIDETVTAFFLLTELISLLENVGKMGYDTPKNLIDKIKDIKNKQ